MLVYSLQRLITPRAFNTKLGSRNLTSRPGTPVIQPMSLYFPGSQFPVLHRAEFIGENSEL